MEESKCIREARKKITEAKEGVQQFDERVAAAVELAALMLEEAERTQTKSEKREQTELAGMMNDPIGKVFTTTFTDECFRSHSTRRVANQLSYLIKTHGVPAYLTWDKRLGLKAVAVAGPLFSKLMIPLTVHAIRQKTSRVILPGEEGALRSHLRRRREEGVKVNLNHLGEAILGEEEAARRLKLYLSDLEDPDIDYISIKISTLFSQIHMLAWDKTLEILADRLRQLYRVAMKHSVPKFVNLDMEEYRDLHLTVALFKKVLDEPEFLHYRAGIVLQSYLPDSYEIQKDLTEWAMQRCARGGAPVKIRIVKGANLAMEQVEAAVRLWPQAPYSSKQEVDANFKRMVEYGCQKEHAAAVHLGIGSHNLFDIAYVMLLRSQNGIEEQVAFEMLEGMADHIRRVVQKLAGGILLYCPAAKKDDFQNAIAYLIRRLDENTAPDNFLRHVFDLKPGTEAWKQQVALFEQAARNQSSISSAPRRQQNRLEDKTASVCAGCQFENEADTDWSLPQNRAWAASIYKEWENKSPEQVPVMIDGQAEKGEMASGLDPSRPGKPFYQFTLGSADQANRLVAAAKQAEGAWSKTSVEERAQLLEKAAEGLRRHRGDLIGAMIADAGKTMAEADVEVSEAIDFAVYYRHSLLQLNTLRDVEWSPKGTILVTPPWNFPCSIPAGGVLAALATGNCVIFKPAAESVLTAWTLANVLWEAGFSKKVLQFFTCADDPVGSQLICDKRINGVVLTGATATAKLFLKMRPDLDLTAETGGKNIMVISALSDRDLAIRDLIHSAFGHAGQKCSACSIAILEAEVYDDPHFMQQLRDATMSMTVGSAWNPATKVNPLIAPPGPALQRGLTQLDAGESWLVEPKPDPASPHLWSPGIKLGVTPESFTFQTELFGPVLGLVRASSFQDALEMMNRTPYGLTAGLHSLDIREQSAWLNRVEAGNCYVNRTITGAVVQRQPFGGMKASSFGRGSKAGGPNYLLSFMQAKALQLPAEQEVLSPELEQLNQKASSFFNAEELKLWSTSLGSYRFYFKHYFSKQHDPSRVMGQDNLLRYLPSKASLFRIQANDSFIDILRVIAAALLCKTPLEVSLDDAKLAEKLKSLTSLPIHVEKEGALISRLAQGKVKHLRLLQQPSDKLQEAIAAHVGHLHLDKVMANGRLELLHYLTEQSISRDYHRYGNLGAREKEPRAPLINQPCEEKCPCHE